MCSQVRFLNSQVQGNNINSEQAALQVVQQVKFSGLTPLGTALDQKILQPLLLGPARQRQLQKPLLVIAITDGKFFPYWYSVSICIGTDTDLDVGRC